MKQIIKKYYNHTVLFAVLLILFAVAGRLLPHAWNATPLVAVGIISGIYLGRTYAVFVPIIAMVLSDIFIGFYDIRMMFAVYGSFALIGIIAYVLRRFNKIYMLIGMSVSASTLFFLVTNTAVWAFTPMYPGTVSGLFSALIAGIPFYKTMLMSDVVHTVFLFGVYHAYMYVIGLSFVKKERESISHTTEIEEKIHFHNYDVQRHN